MLNPIDGVIIAQSLLSPSAGKGVPLRAWDDLTWFQWARMHDPARKNKSDEHYRDFNRIFWHVTTDRIPLMRHWLHWIVFQGLKEPEETLRVIATGMASRGFRDGAVPDWEHRLTFPVGHWYAFAPCRERLATTLTVRAGATMLCWQPRCQGVLRTF